MRALRALLIACALASAAGGRTAPLTQRRPSLPLRTRAVRARAAVRASSGGYDMSRAQFDLLSLRSVRRDALLQYASTNQSEPLRILLYALLAAIFALAPVVANEVPSGISILLEGAPARAACVASAFGSAALFARERGRRTAQLVRLERECALRELSIVLEEDGRGRRVVPLAALGGERAAIIVLGSAAHVEGVLAQAAVYAPRLAEAEVVLVGVPLGGGALSLPAAPWLATAAGPKQWERFAAELVGGGGGGGGDGGSGGGGNGNGDGGGEAGALARVLERGGWIALTRRGRSCGSALGAPDVDELLGARYGPREPLPPAGAWAERAARAARAAATTTTAGSGVVPAGGATSATAHASLLAAQARFYAALGASDLSSLARLWSERSVELAAATGTVPAVWLFDEEAARRGGSGAAEQREGKARMDSWRAVLADGATNGLRVGGEVATLLPSSSPSPSPPESIVAAAGGAVLLEALTSCIEYPAERLDGPPAPTLLATQRWLGVRRPRAGAEADEDEVEWALVSHRTIPFTYRMGAMACLRCDSRGCVAYNRNG